MCGDSSNVDDQGTGNSFINPFPTHLFFKNKFVYGTVASCPLGPPPTGSSAVWARYG